ncbi:MAG TPA: GntR family transcriptional regulator [Trebonia sp.]|nr:GntR family transcriptional regulator [Trebonia sp.]
MATDRPRRLAARVRVYEQIVDAIHDGTFPPGSLLPSEPELAVILKVSRPALREALILLQEDRVITLRRGVGRTVRGRPRRAGLERLQSIETLLGPDEVIVQAVSRVVEALTDFTAHHLLVGPTSLVRFWESVVYSADVAVCLAQEWSTDDQTLARLHPDLPGVLEHGGEGRATMLNAILACGKADLLSGSSTIAATVLGRERGRALGRAADTPVLLIQQTVRADEVPLMVSKYMLPTGAPQIPVIQPR